MEYDNVYKLRHSLSHVLAMAVLEEFPDAKLAIGPPVENGFYYDFDLPRSVQPDDLKLLEAKMRDIVKKKLPFTHSLNSVAEAKERFTGQPYKTELIAELEKDGATELGFYTTGSFVDLCKGPHVENTADIPLDCFALSHAAGAYWRGDEKRPMLQRIYGLAFENAAALQEYRAMVEEAKKRDHRKLGAELDLFTFSDLVGAGLPLWAPKGNTLRNLLDHYVWELRSANGYERVEIPHITKKDLYEKSGHWEKFQDELFRIKTREGHEFVMKPMNCPHHTQIFARKRWSYRDMPQRYANTTTCYRDEQSGELNGLSRVRAFSQDDAHVFCRYSQVKEEINRIWNIIDTFYGTFGFEMSLRLSFHDPAAMGSYLGTPEIWEKAEHDIRELADERQAAYFLGIGEAAFYGPKLDFMAKDSLGREWQLATIQLDMNMPNRFGLSYIDEAGEEAEVLMIHAAIMGSLERFISVMIEHTAGNFPLWLAPVQIAVLPVSDQFNEASDEVARLFRSKGLRVVVDTSSESVGKKIRNASLQKIPAKIVIGEKEVASLKSSGEWQFSVNWRSDIAESADLQAASSLLDRLQELVSARRS